MAKITELLQDIEKFNVVLPEFQREYVWTKEQAKQLIKSLLKGYPTGSLLFWKTDNPPDIKHDAVPPNRLQAVNVLLDGQQRLTTLYLLIRDEIPPYYVERDITNDPRDLYFNLSTRELQYYQSSRMKDDPAWVAVTDCFEDGKIDPFQLATNLSSEGKDQFELANLFNQSLNALQGIHNHDYPIQIVPDEANVDEAIDVFDRVNSMGTKLSDAELAMAHVTGKWPHARREMKEKIDELAEQHFSFDLTFMVRCLTGIVKGRALFETIHDARKQELVDGWETLSGVLDYLVTILPIQAHIHSTEDLNTTNVLVAMVVYLADQGGEFCSEEESKRFVHWLYAAHTWRRYTSQSDTRLDHDVSIALRSPTPCAELVEAIMDQRGRIEVRPSDLEGRWIQHPLYRMAYVTAKAKGAVDWFNGVPLGSEHKGTYGFQSHHIFPSSLLYDEAGYSSENHMDQKRVNEIANRAFLTAQSNISLSNERPAAYVKDVEERYPGALENQFVPLNEELWKLQNYEEFIAKRRELIAQAINEYMDSLLSEYVFEGPDEFEALLSAGESQSLEYKSSLRWDMHRQQVNKDLEHVIVKTLAGFLNAEGGTLLIGVDDEGSVVGIEWDMKTLRGEGLDRYEQQLVQLITRHIGAQFCKYVGTRFEQTDGDYVCICRVESAPQPAWVDEDPDKRLYIRAGNTTRPLDAQAAHDYIGMHWEY